MSHKDEVESPREILSHAREIHDAARDGDVGKVRALLKETPDLVFSKDNIGRTPLHVAAEEAH